MRTKTLKPEQALPAISKGMSKESRDEITRRCAYDPILFFDTFLSDWFSGEIPFFHRGMVAILLQRVEFLALYPEVDKIIENFTYRLDGKPTNYPMFHFVEGRLILRTTPFVLFMLPRGFSKTTIVNGCVLHSILYKTVKFPLLLSESSWHSTAQLGSIKRQLADNDNLRMVYGNLVPDRQDSRKWTEDRITTTTNIPCVSKGHGGQVRGSNIGGQRPDWIILDDVEGLDSVSTAERRNKTKRWFYQDVMPALPLIGKSGRMVIACTLLHRDCLTASLLEDPQWTSVRFGATDTEGKPLWEQAMSLKKLNQLRNAFARQGLLAEFHREYFNTFRHEESQKFKADYITIENCPRKDFLNISLVLDPAISQSKDADFCSFAIVGIKKCGTMVVLESYSKQGMLPREQIDTFFELYQQWRPTVCGVESIAYQHALIYLMKEEMARRSCFFAISPITHGRVAKVARIEGVLQPRYASGFIKHRISFPLLEQQLFDFPQGKKDAPDAVAMAVTLLEPSTGTSYDPTKAFIHNQLYGKSLNPEPKGAP